MAVCGVAVLVSGGAYDVGAVVQPRAGPGWVSLQALCAVQEADAHGAGHADAFVARA